MVTTTRRTTVIHCVDLGPEKSPGRRKKILGCVPYLVPKRFQIHESRLGILAILRWETPPLVYSERKRRSRATEMVDDSPYGYTACARV